MIWLIVIFPLTFFLDILSNKPLYNQLVKFYSWMIDLQVKSLPIKGLNQTKHFSNLK